MSPTNPLLDPEGYVGDVPTGRPSYDPGEYPDVRAADLDAEQAALAAGGQVDDPPHDEDPDGGDADLAPFALGNGWYEIDGVKVQGKAKAREALEARG